MHVVTFVRLYGLLEGWRIPLLFPGCLLFFPLFRVFYWIINPFFGCPPLSMLLVPSLALFLQEVGCPIFYHPLVFTPAPWIFLSPFFYVPLPACRRCVRFSPAFLRAGLGDRNIFSRVVPRPFVGKFCGMFPAWYFSPVPILVFYPFGFLARRPPFLAHGFPPPHIFNPCSVPRFFPLFNYFPLFFWPTDPPPPFSHGRSSRFLF